MTLGFKSTLIVRYLDFTQTFADLYKNSSYDFAAMQDGLTLNSQIATINLYLHFNDVIIRDPKFITNALHCIYPYICG